MKKTIALLLTLATLAACNTIEGAGADISAAGKAISNTSSRTKQQM